MRNQGAQKLDYDDWSSVMDEDVDQPSAAFPANDTSMQASELPQERVLVLSGKLENMPLPDLAQTLEANRKTGVMEITSEFRCGKIAFLDGAIVGAWANQLVGAAAVYRLLGYVAGDFYFYAEPVSPAEVPEQQPGLPAGVQGLLMEGMRHIDEIERIRKDLPGEDVVLALPATPQGEEIFTLSEAALTLFTSVESDTTYNELLAESELCDLELAQSLSDLIRGGFLIALDKERQVPRIRLVPELPAAGTVAVRTELDAELAPKPKPIFRVVVGGLGVLGGLAAVVWGVTNFGLMDPSSSAPIVAQAQMSGDTGVGSMGGTGASSDAALGSAALEPTCPAGMKLVTGGKFFRGSQSEEAIFANATPAHAVKLDSYCLDTYEVSVKAYRACSRSGDCERAHRQVWWPKPASKSTSQWKQERRALAEHCNENGNARLDHPVNCVTWNQAKNYCEQKGQRLPTEAEWEYAARGSDGRVYPWGDEAPSAKHLNGCGQECTKRRERDGLAEVEPMYPGDDGFATTAPVGSFPAGVGQWGHQDLLGNVFEWTADSYTPYSKLPELVKDDEHVFENPRYETGERRVFRGGGFNSYRTAFTNPALRASMSADAHTHGIGFRCAADPIMK